MKKNLTKELFSDKILLEDEELKNLEINLKKKFEDLKARKKYNHQSKLENIEKTKKQKMKRLL